MLACLGFFSLWRGKLPCMVNFLCGLKLREMPCFKGFRGLSITKAKKVSFVERFLLANCSCRANVSPLPVATLNNNPRT